MKKVLLIFFSFFCFSFLSSPIFASSIKINEFYSIGGGTDPDWVEIYFDGVNASLYQLSDALGTSPKSLSTANCSGNFCTIDWSNRLNNDGDTIKLTATSSGEIVDQIIYGDTKDIPAPKTGQSAGRRTDGTGEWVIFSSHSKGYSNNSSIPVPSSTPNPTDEPTPTSTPTSTKTPTPTSTPTPTKTTTPTKTPTLTVKPTTKPSITPTDTPNIAVSILGTSSANISPTISPEPENQNTESPLTKIFFIGGGLIILLIAAFAASFVLKDKIPFFKL